MLSSMVSQLSCWPLNPRSRFEPARERWIIKGDKLPNMEVLFPYRFTVLIVGSRTFFFGNFSPSLNSKDEQNLRLKSSLNKIRVAYYHFYMIHGSPWIPLFPDVQIKFLERQKMLYKCNRCLETIFVSRIQCIFLNLSTELPKI